MLEFFGHLILAAIAAVVLLIIALAILYFTFIFLILLLTMLVVLVLLIMWGVVESIIWLARNVKRLYRKIISRKV